MVELHQSRTYAGLLAGRPDARMNRGHIEEALASAKQYGIEGCEPYLVAPAPAVLRSQLPAVMCIAVLESGELHRDPREPYSSLTVTWWQDQLAPPLEPAIEQHIRGIDWELRAVPFCP
jgi:hypothetical protein